VDAGMDLLRNSLDARKDALYGSRIH